MTREEAIKVVKSATVYTPEEMEALETLIPELRESEDERVRKIITDSVFLAYGANDEYRDVLDYLDRCGIEKQKEQIPYIDFVIKPHKGDDNNPYDMQVSEAQEYAIKRGFGVPFNDGEVYVDERHIIQTIGNILRWADDHPKEQKPAEINVKALLAADRLASAEMTGRLKERSEILENPEKYGLQKTAEWSEEDERMLERAIHIIVEYSDIDEKESEIVQNWLKSLRPQPQKLEDWTEEDEKLLSDALACVTMVQEIKKRGELKNFHISCTGEELRSWIRSLKSRPRKQPRWKPSEEQMEAFCRCVDYLEESDNEDADIMAELYEQLKAL